MAYRTIRPPRKPQFLPPSSCIGFANALGWQELTAVNCWEHKVCAGKGCDKCDAGTMTGMPLISYGQYVGYKWQLDVMSNLIRQKLAAGEHGNFQQKQIAIDSLARWLRTRVRPPRRNKQDCPNCEGTGKVNGLFCRKCGGRGEIFK